jgi:TPR repeat protein
LSITAAGYRAVSDSVRLRAGERLLYAPPTMERIQQVAQEPRPQPRPAPAAEPPPEETPAADTPIVQIIPGQRQVPAGTTASQPRPTAETCEALFDAGNVARARGLCEQEAGQGNAEAAYVLGVMYEQGQGVTANLSRAVEEYRRAASGGSARAQLNLGLMHQDGRGVSRDPRAAADLFRRSAERGLADGQAQLGFAYQLGVGVAQDLGIAAEWYRRGAEQGHAWSQYLLGHLLYQGGPGRDADPVEAVRWLSSAAEQDVIAAQLELAAAYRDGRGVAQSDAAAIEWFERAGTPEAQAEAQRLRRRD